jgi:hypothetical protein
MEKIHKEILGLLGKSITIVVMKKTSLSLIWQVNWMFSIFNGINLLIDAYKDREFNEFIIIRKKPLTTYLLPR